MPVRELVTLIGGLLALFFGRRLFWLFAGLLGFVLGLRLGIAFFGEGWWDILFALAVGAVCAWLVVGLQRLAILAIGGLAGAVVLPGLAELVGWSPGLPWWALAIIGAVAGAIFLSVAFDWGLIILSSIVGANVVTQAITPRLELEAQLAAVVLVVLTVVGMLFQAGQMRHRR